MQVISYCNHLASMIIVQPETMPETIKRQPRASSIRGATYRETETYRPSGTREQVTIETPYGGGTVNRSLSRTIPSAAPDSSPVIQAMRERFKNTPEDIRERENAGRERENAGRERYNAFLADQGIEADAIGSARLVGNSRDRRMILPTREEEEAVNEAIAIDSTMSSRDRNAAVEARRRGRSDIYADIMNRLQAGRDITGGRSSERRRSFWRDRFTGESPYQQYVTNANGFAY